VPSSYWILDLSGPKNDIRLSILSPVDVGMRFIHDAVMVRNLVGGYPID